jgi:hypothetical protein
LLILLEEFWWRAQNQNEGQNFLRGAAAAEQLAGGGLFQVLPLFGFMYQIWQNDFKSMPRRELVLLRGLRWFGFGSQVWRYEIKIFRRDLIVRPTPPKAGLDFLDRQNPQD